MRPQQLPFELPKELAAQAQQLMAVQLENNFRLTYPSSAFIGDFKRDKSPTFGSTKIKTENKKELSAFFGKNPTFDFLITNIEKEKDISKELKQQLQSIQRVFKLSLDYRTTAVLLQDNIHSAQQIYAMGESNFVQKYKRKDLDEATLKKTFSKAQDTQAAVVQLITELKAMDNAQDVFVLRNGNATKTNSNALVSTRSLASSSVSASARGVGDLFPNWQNLFGSGDVCECQHCRSVYSPSAYFADILMFLKHRNAKIGTVKDELFKRRPDLGLLELSCENANIEIPYIDVVCEVLENAVVPDGISKQSKGTAEELAAIPQYINAAAYQKLKAAQAPMALPSDFFNKDLKVSLPFDLFSEEMRAYLAKHKVARWELMQTLQGNPATIQPTEGDIASEYFNISVDKTLILPDLDENRIILIAAATLSQQKKYWSEATTLSDADFINKVSNVNVFLNKTGLEYNDLLQLLDLSFINPTGNLSIVHEDASCDTSKKHIENLDATSLDKIHRFLRLWRKLKDWQTWELDLVLQHANIGNNQLNEAFLIQLMNFSILKNHLALSVEEIVALFGTINIKSKFTEPFHDRKSSLYEHLFLNKRKTNPIDAAFAITLVTAPATESLSAHKATLMAGLKLKEADVDVLLKYTGLDTAVNNLTLANLSILYSHSMLSKVLQMKMLAYTQYLDLSQSDFNVVFNNPKNALVWWQQSPALQPTDESMETLLYILKADLSVKPAAQEKAVATFLENLRKALQAIQKEYDATQYSCLDVITRTAEIAVVKAAEVDPIEATALEQQLLIDLVNKIKEVLTPIMQKVGKTDVEIATTLKSDDPVVLANEAKILLIELAKQATEKTIHQQFADNLGLGIDIIQKLLSHNFTGIGSPTLLDKFKENTFIIGSLPMSYGSDKTYFDCYYWLNRVGYLLKKWAVKIDELNWLLAYNYKADQKDILAIASLPIDNMATAASYQKLVNLHQLFQLQRAHSIEGLSVLNILKKIDENATTPYPATAFANDLHLLHEEWTVADVDFLANNLNASYPTDYVFVSTWQRLEKAINFITQINGTASSVMPFINPSVDAANVAALKKMLQESYSESQWLEFNKDVQGSLRNRKRDSLIAYLLQQPAPLTNLTGKWENVNDLYAYYLLDVQMDACFITSRLVQASGSVQLFVQRCLMGLEPNVVVDTKSETADLGWLQWDWMKNYRVWEANRKVFLYPENWIEPQLRRDKSPFFKDLENELLQNEVNKDNVETAFLNYIEKLDTVAQLEIAGQYYEESRNVLHVFGRTALAEPHVYYHRFYDDNRGNWSAWTKIDADITGDYLIPTMINDRLYLFWPIFTEVAVPKTSFDIPKADAENSAVETPEKFLKIQLAVTEFRNKKWQPKKISKDYITSNTYQGELLKKSYKFYPIDDRERSGKFIIACEGYSHIGEKAIGAIGRMQFEVFGCKGIPEKNLSPIPLNILAAIQPVESDLENMKPLEQSWRSHGNDFFALNQDADTNFVIEGNNSKRYTYTGRTNIFSSNHILEKTPGRFKVTTPIEASFLDKVLANSVNLFVKGDLDYAYIGNYMPFFFADKDRTFLIKPLVKIGTQQSYYPELKGFSLEVRKFFGDWGENVISTLKGQGTLQAAAAYFKTFLTQRGFDTANDLSDEEVIRYRIKLIADYYTSVGVLLAKPYIRYHFFNFYHPYTCLFAKQVYNFGIDGLMKREVQLKNSALALLLNPTANNNKFDFKRIYNPTPLALNHVVDIDAKKDYKYYPMEVVDFTSNGAYSLYNWELFYHAPLMIATRLSQNQRFSEAMQWFHYIFNPLDPTTTTDSSGNPTSQKYWITKPFFAMQAADYNAQRIDTILNMLSSTRSANLETTLLEKQVKYWRSNPFEPHIVAQNRPVAYQKTVVMKYIDNLVAWGDNLFRRDTMESLNEATQLYVLAAEILGPRPRKVSPQFQPKPMTFNDLESKMDAFSNAAVELENLIPAIESTSAAPAATTATVPNWLYFCIPQNDKLLGYWDTVADRLYKIRHCMNIDGVVRKLSLFEPPIDPAALINAIAGGGTITGALADLNAPLPYHRFNIMLQKANELCNDVKSLGGALLSALEKKDGEALSLLRQSQEMKVLDAVREVKLKQIAEAKDNLEGVYRSKKTTEERQQYYKGIQKLNSQEQLNLSKMKEAQTFQEIAQGLQLGASIQYLRQRQSI